MKPSKKESREKLRDELLKEIDAGGVAPGHAVKAYRKILGMTQSQFAEFQGVSYNMVKMIENRRGNPTLGILAKLLRGSGLDIKVGRSNK